MSDDQDGCEWVSVSSGTGLPGLSRTKGRKTVVFVCVLLFLFTCTCFFYCSVVTMHKRLLCAFVINE